MASDEPFNYHSGLWLLLSHIILGQTCSKLRNESIEDSDVGNCFKKIHFLLPADFESKGMMSHKDGLAAKYSFKMAASEIASFETNFFRIAALQKLKLQLVEKPNVYLL